MRAEHLRQWLIAATRDNSSDDTNWLKVVAIVQAAFQDRALAEECIWQTVVLIPAGRGDFQGILLVEIIWKAIASLLNCRLIAAISFYDIIYRFRDID